tara:strand:+ start:374 stop:544 length:171 start_codon:yes stop_codon:yes gene_type:complete
MNNNTSTKEKKTRGRPPKNNKGLCLKNNNSADWFSSIFTFVDNVLVVVNNNGNDNK